MLGEWTERLRREAGDAFPESVTAFREGMAVHGRHRQPCPVCGTAVQRIVRAENEVNYCPRCQTGGQILSDRSLARLLKEDWPRTVDELERNPALGLRPGPAKGGGRTERSARAARPPCVNSRPRRRAGGRSPALAAARRRCVVPDAPVLPGDAPRSVERDHVPRSNPWNPVHDTLGETHCAKLRACVGQTDCAVVQKTCPI